MPDLTQEKVNIPAWISLEEASKVLNLSSKTIKEHCRKGKLTYKIVVENKYRHYAIALDSLPEYANKKFLNNNDIDAAKYAEAPFWAKVQADNYLPVIKATVGLRGKDLKQFINNWNCNNPDNVTSYPSVIRMKRRYFQE